MAEGYLRHVAGDQFEPLSAGIEPKGLNPLAVEAMREIGIDISKQRSKDVREFLGQAIPYVITVCDNARERCPIFPRTYKFLHWSFDDPAAAQGSHDEKLTVFRRVRDELRRRIDEELVSSFPAGHVTAG
jgi:arsenate reductase